MKMVYAKTSYSCCSLTDMMGPVAKLQLSGEKLVVAMPITSAAASLNATSPGGTMSVPNLFQHMLAMGDTAFSKAGGIVCHMLPGDFLWIPERCLVSEYILGKTPDDISTWLSWLAMTEWHMTDEAIKNVQSDIDFCKQRCCEPSQRLLETQLEAGRVSAYIMHSIDHRRY